MLFWHKHNIEKSLADLPNFTPFPDEWTVEDKVLFEQGFSFHGKTFHRIQQMVSGVDCLFSISPFTSSGKIQHFHKFIFPLRYICVMALYRLWIVHEQAFFGMTHILRQISLLMKVSVCRGLQRVTNLSYWIANSEPSANTNRLGHRNSFQFHFPLPHSVNLRCWFAIRSMLYQINSVFFLQTALSDLKQQGYGLNYVIFFPLNSAWITESSIRSLITSPSTLCEGDSNTQHILYNTMVT